MFSVQKLERCTPDPVAAGRMLAATDGEFVLRSTALERENALIKAFEQSVAMNELFISLIKTARPTAPHTHTSGCC